MAILIHNQHTLKPVAKFEQYLPLLLPLFLLFSRALADVTVLLVGIIFLFRCYRLNDWQWMKHTWFKLILLFWGYLLCINVPLSIAPSNSFIYTIAFMRWPLFAAALAYWLFADQKRQRQLLISLLIVSLFVILDTSLQYFTGQDAFGHAKASQTRLTGPFSRPIPGIILLRVWFISMFSALILPQAMHIKHRITLILLMLLIGLTFMFITGERMALMLFIAGSAIVIAGLLFSFNGHKKKIIGGLSLAVGLSTTLVFIAPDTAERSVYSVFHKLADFPNSDYGVVFRAGFSAWQEHFMFGSGLHTYKTVCTDLGVLSALGKQWNMQCSHPHNLYLQIAAETGVIGLILFTASIVSIYFSALYKLILSKKWLITSLSFTTLSVCFWPLIGGISLLNNGVAAVVWLGVGWVLAMPRATFDYTYA